jgi:ethanolamine utilization protein EutN
MLLAKVVGPVVMSVKHASLSGEKVLLVQPCDATGKAMGAKLMAIDRAQAGEGDRVLVLREGTGVRQILKSNEPLPIRSLIVGIVDQVTHA